MTSSRGWPVVLQHKYLLYTQPSFLKSGCLVLLVLDQVLKRDWFYNVRFGFLRKMSNCVVGEAIIVTVLVKENHISVSTLNSGCCRIPYQYLMDKSYKDNKVHFIDCINLSRVKANCTGTMCIFRTKSKEKNCVTDWNLEVVLYFSYMGLSLYKFDYLSCFS